MTSTRHTRRTLAGLTIAILMLCLAVSCAAQPDGTTIWVSWIAPGDDDLTGRAWQYDLRYRTVPVGSSVASWWGQATHVAGVPQPSQAGVLDSVLVTGLSAGTTYYFVLRVGDEALNWSSHSNTTSAQTTGTTEAPAGSSPPSGGSGASDLRAYPNPASGTVRFELHVGGIDPRAVRIRMFDLNGHVVAEVADGIYPSGVSSITWNRRANAGQAVVPGYTEVIGTVGTFRVRERLLLLP
jgi:hypothetical protein